MKISGQGVYCRRLPCVDLSNQPRKKDPFAFGVERTERQIFQDNWPVVNLWSRKFLEKGTSDRTRYIGFKIIELVFLNI